MAPRVATRTPPLSSYAAVLPRKNHPVHLTRTRKTQKITRNVDTAKRQEQDCRNNRCRQLARDEPVGFSYRSPQKCKTISWSSSEIETRAKCRCTFRGLQEFCVAG